MEEKLILGVMGIIGVIAVISLATSFAALVGTAPVGQFVQRVPAPTNYPQADGGWTPGQFIVVYESDIPVRWCNYSGDNYDPFQFGTIYTDWGNRADSCEVNGTNFNMVEWSCVTIQGNLSYNLARATFGQCTKRCTGGHCIQ